MHRLQFSLKTLLWLTALAAAFCAGTQLHRYLDEHRADPNETRIWAALDEMTTLDLVEQPLFAVLDYLKQRHGIEIQLDHRALMDAGIGSDTPMTRSVRSHSAIGPQLTSGHPTIPFQRRRRCERQSD